jgi:hypothetical protein
MSGLRKKVSLKNVTGFRNKKKYLGHRNMASSRSKKNEKSKIIIVAIMHKCVGKGDLGYLVSK